MENKEELENQSTEAAKETGVEETAAAPAEEVKEEAPKAEKKETKKAPKKAAVVVEEEEEFDWDNVQPKGFGDGYSKKEKEELRGTLR